ncbi:MAG: Zn-ribbon domain-containing OB-fold protein [Alphaproteobacteria bacterium]
MAAEKGAYGKPVPVVDADSAPYWHGAKEGRLMIQRCRETGRTFLYSRRLVPGAGDADWIEASGEGEIYSWTVARRPAGAAFKEDVPYVVASVTLAEGARILTNIVTDDPDGVHIGQKVRVVFDAVSDELTIPKFRPVD